MITRGISTAKIFSSCQFRYLARNNIRFPTGYKFALGCAFGACAILWSILVESMIHEEYARTGGRINVIWSAPSYIMIGAGEMFSISTGYEVAFTASPPNKKAFACAFNLFCIGGVPNLVSLVLYRLCRRWFETDSGGGNIGRIENYSEAHVANYFWVLFGIIVSGMIVNMNKSVREWIKSVEQRAANALSRSVPSTPKTPKGGPSKRKVDDAVGETDPLLKAKKQMKYLERGTRASIYRANTMKAEFSKQNSPSPRKKTNS
jgi:POT family proton-dependent oligopeptide transporter